MNKLNEGSTEVDRIKSDVGKEYNRVYYDYKRSADRAVDDKKTELDEMRHQTLQLKEQLKDKRNKMREQEDKLKRQEVQVKQQEATLKSNHNDRMRIAKSTIKRKQSELDKLN